MKIDFPEHIIKCLAKHKSVAIPNLGSLTYTSNPALFSDDKSRLEPPSSRIDFTERQDGFPLIEYLRDKNIGTEKEISNQITKYVQRLINNLLNLQKTEIDRIGIFRKEKGSAIRFESLNNVLTSEAYGLPAIEVNAIHRVELDALTQSDAVKSYKAKKPDMWKYWLPFLLMLVISAAVIYFCCCKEGRAINGAEKITKEEVKPTSNEANSGLSTERKMNNEERTSSSNPSTCIIITGSFSRAINVLKMTNLLEDSGYVVHSEQYGDLTRVGFTFDCSKVDMTEYIHKIRKEISKDAWYLVPQITVY